MSSPLIPPVRPNSPTILANEEREGLLAGIDASDDYRRDNKATRPAFSEAWPSKRMAVITVISLISLLVGSAFALAFFYTTPPPAHPDLDFQGHALRSNGTHNFKRTVIMVSIDGLR
jgi:hypothetical protein